VRKWSPRAASHLEQICEYIAVDSKTYAGIYAKKVLSSVDGIALFPEAGRVVPEYSNPNLREQICDNQVAGTMKIAP